MTSALFATGACTRCGTLSDQLSPGPLPLCPACPLAPVACGEFLHDYRAAQVDDVMCWACWRCGAMLASEPIQVGEPQEVPD